MVALVVSLTALALLGLSTHLPGWLGRDAGISDIEPGLLTVARTATGVVTLGGGVSVSLYSDGLRVMRGDDLLLQTVIRGSLLSAVQGHAETADTKSDETVTASLDNLAIDELVFLPGRATYFGRVYDSQRSLPVTLEVELEGGVVRLGANVNGADAVVWHLDREPATYGLRPALPPHNLRKSATWLSPSARSGQAAFSTLLGTDVGVGPQRVPRGVDLRSAGRTDVHVWSDSGFLTVTSQATHPAPPSP